MSVPVANRDGTDLPRTNLARQAKKIYPEWRKGRVIASALNGQPVSADPQETTGERLSAKSFGRGRVLENDLLHVFVTVALCEGFTSAAKILNRTQAAVSLQIKRLEDVAGGSLLSRSSRKVELTPMGQILFEYAQRILALNEEALLALHSKVPAGPIRVGTYHHFATVELPSILSEFAEIYPQIWVEVQDGLAIAMEERLGKDLEVLVGLEETPSPGSVVLRRESVSWYTSARHQQHLRDPLPLALLPQGSLFRKWGIDSLSDKQKPWRIAQISTSAPALEAAVAHGVAISIFKAGTPIQKDVIAIGPEQGFPKLPDAVITVRTAPNPSIAARLFAEFVAGKVQAGTR